MTTRRTLLAAGAGLLAAPGIVQAQGDWPNKTVRVIVPWPPGGSTDVLATFLKGDKVAPQVFIKHVIIDISNIDAKLPKS